VGFSRDAASADELAVDGFRARALARRALATTPRGVSGCSSAIPSPVISDSQQALMACRD
jgi:hypothetical protein